MGRFSACRADSKRIIRRFVGEQLSWSRKIDEAPVDAGELSQLRRADKFLHEILHLKGRLVLHHRFELQSR
ncbi:hypothetical protein Q2941_50985 [Bradyrhizobium sp. UFLA05-153]